MLKKVFLILVIVVLILIGIYLLMPKNPSIQSAPVAQESLEQSVAQAQEIERSVLSLDGTKKLTMKEEANDPTRTFSFYIDANTTPVFTRSYTDGTTMALPDNAWAPNDQYIFLREDLPTGVKNYLVLKTDGTAFSNGEMVKNVTELFAAKGYSYSLNEATGWADPTLLILTTKNTSGARGPSFWFEAPSSALMQLYR